MTASTRQFYRRLSWRLRWCPPIQRALLAFARLDWEAELLDRYAP